MGTVTSIAALIASQREEADRRRAVDPETDARNQAAIDRFERARALELRKQNVSGSGISIEAECLKRVVLGTLDATHAFRIVDKWVDVHEGLVPAKSFPGVVLLLLGGPGCGKTAAAAHAIARIGGRQIQSEALAKLYASKAWTHEQQLEALKRCRLVVLDDFGTEREEWREVAKSAIAWLVDGRQDNGRLTIITSNLPDEEKLYALLDERTVSRLVQVGRLLRCKGKDLRVGDGPAKVRSVG